MQTIFVSNNGDDQNDGLSRQTPVFSWERLCSLCTGDHEMFLLEGADTLTRLGHEIQGNPRSFGASGRW
jgi:hypothetical protein